MEHFFIVANTERDKGAVVTDRIADYLRQRGKQVTVRKITSLSEEENPFLPDHADCVIALGGDGTMIRAANDLLKSEIPILGVNLGTLGFLAEINKDSVEQDLDRLLAGEYRIEKRLMIQGELRDDTGHALNDIVIMRKGFSRIINLEIYLNDQLVDYFRGDGVIISTPTGSTAYNLSAGGPIVDPRADVIVITPVCPHSLSPRTIVVSAEDVIRIVVSENKNTDETEVVAAFDGQKIIDMGMGDMIRIKKAQYATGLIKLNQTGIYDILRTKLSNSVD